tara:strand:+ start:1599 stop:1778 length:180 start_codon:yes stop_codon:yes gene_type:complete
MNEDMMTWAHKLSAWVVLVRQRANSPDHPLYATVYMPLTQWLTDNHPDDLGLKLEMTND